MDKGKDAIQAFSPDLYHYISHLHLAVSGFLAATGLAVGFLGIGTSSDVDQLEKRDVSIPADQSIDVLRDVDFSSHETVPERARVSLRLTNRRRPS